MEHWMMLTGLASELRRTLVEREEPDCKGSLKRSKQSGSLTGSRFYGGGNKDRIDPFEQRAKHWKAISAELLGVLETYAKEAEELIDAQQQEQQQEQQSWLPRWGRGTRRVGHPVRSSIAPTSSTSFMIACVGKPSAGKSSFLNAVTSANAKVGNFPFTTIEPNQGVAYYPIECPCKRYNRSDQCRPRYGSCKDGKRLVPVRMLDVAGLVPGASEGRGLGNQFLDDLRHAQVLIHV
ncbi:hypothetical protein EV182_006387, partial [Spiromyces aspiralis]